MQLLLSLPFPFGKGFELNPFICFWFSSLENLILLKTFQPQREYMGTHDKPWLPRCSLVSLLLLSFTCLIF